MALSLAERGPRHRPDDAIPLQPVGPLERPDGALRHPTEDAVDGDVQAFLQQPHIRTSASPPDSPTDPLTDSRRGGSGRSGGLATQQRGPCLATDDAIHQKPVGPLERPNGTIRDRIEPPIGNQRG